LLASTLVTQGLEGAKLIQRVKGDPLDIFRKRILRRRNFEGAVAHDAWNRRCLRKVFLLHQLLERPVAAAAGGYLEHAGLSASCIKNRPDVEALQEAATRDVLGQIVDREAGLQAPDVGLAERQLVEGYVARGAKGDLLTSLCHEGYSATDSRETLSRLTNPSRRPTLPSHSRTPGTAYLPPLVSNSPIHAAINFQSRGRRVIYVGASA
jgi:hypothetical protein